MSSITAEADAPATTASTFTATASTSLSTATAPPVLYIKHDGHKQRYVPQSTLGEEVSSTGNATALHQPLVSTLQPDLLTSVSQHVI